MVQGDRGQVIVEYLVVTFVIVLALAFLLPLLGIEPERNPDAEEASWHGLEMPSGNSDDINDNLMDALNDAYRDTCLVVGLPVP